MGGIREVAEQEKWQQAEGANGCRRVDLKPTEILVKVFMPFTQKLEYVKEFKQAHRRDDDIAIANAGMRVRLMHTADGVPLPCILLPCCCLHSALNSAAAPASC